LWMKRNRLYPGSEWDLYQLADLQNKLGRYQDAYDTIQKAIAINPTNYHYYDTLEQAENGLGYSAGQIVRERAEHDQFAAELLRQRGSKYAQDWEDERWRLLSKLVNKPEAKETRCNKDLTVCSDSRVLEDNSDWALFTILDIKEAGPDTRIVNINHGEESGIVAGSTGNVYAVYSWKKDDQRPEVKIGTAEVLSVGYGSAKARVKMTKPEGGGLVRVGDTIGLEFRVPKIEHRSTLWSVVKFSIGFEDQNDKKIADFDTLYSKETPDLDRALYQDMLNDIHEYGRLKGDSLNDGKPVSEGKKGAKPVKVREVLESANQEDLDRFFKYMIKFPRSFFGYKWRVSALYANWAEQGMPEE
jgi:hypothetical protein